MNYINIFLSVLLAPCALTYCSNTEMQIQQLKEELYKKELELSRLGKEIEEQEKLIEAMFDKLIDLHSQIQNSLNQNEKNEFLAELNAFQKRFDDAIDNLQIKNFLLTEFFIDKDIKIERVKSIMIRSSIERELLKELIRNYEAKLQELAQLFSKLSKFEKLT